MSNSNQYADFIKGKAGPSGAQWLAYAAIKAMP